MNCVFITRGIITEARDCFSSAEYGDVWQVSQAITLFEKDPVCIS